MSYPSQFRVILLGLDGLTFQLVAPLVQEGVLPNLQAIMEQGCSGILRSTVPPSTAPAWVSCVTGVNPGKHGIFDFRAPLNIENRRYLISARSVRAEKIWSILNRHGKRAGVLNVPVSYPPEPLQGFMVSGMMTPGSDVTYTYPHDLKDRLGDYVIDLKSQAYEIMSVGDAKRFLQDATAMFERRWRVFQELMEEDWHFFMAVFVTFDRIQHRLWKFLDPRCDLARTPGGRSIRDMALEVIHRVDERLGTLVSHLPSDTLLIIVSDHGFGPLDAFFNVNSWLADQGLLTFRGGRRLGARLFRTLASLSANPAVRRLLPHDVEVYVRERIRHQRTMLRQSIEDKVDWTVSRAYFPSNLEQAIYLLSPQGGRSDEVQELRDSIVDGLRSLVMPRDDKPLVDEIYVREDVFHGPWAEQAAPIYINCRNYSVLGNAQIGRSEWFTYLDDDPRGFHQPDGAFLAIGPGFERDKRLSTYNIIDVTPTVLYAMGLPTPDYMDGRIISEAFTPAFCEQHPVMRKKAGSGSLVEPASMSFSEEEAELISGRLRALGYLD